nr:basic proline-rich protein-like [Aegilops tauschii subsp. strangulata]
MALLPRWSCSCCVLSCSARLRPELLRRLQRLSPCTSACAPPQRRVSACSAQCGPARPAAGLPLGSWAPLRLLGSRPPGLPQSPVPTPPRRLPGRRLAPPARRLRFPAAGCGNGSSAGCYRAPSPPSPLRQRGLLAPRGRVLRARRLRPGRLCLCPRTGAPPRARAPPRLRWYGGRPSAPTRLRHPAPPCGRLLLAARPAPRAWAACFAPASPPPVPASSARP